MDLQELKNIDIDKTKLRGVTKFTSQRSRITANTYIVYEQIGEKPFPIEIRGSKPITNSESPIKRTFRIKPNEQVPLNLEWLEGKAGRIVIENATGEDLAMQPEEDVKKKIDSSYAIIELGPVALPLPPKQHMVIPAPGVKIQLSARVYESLVRVWVLPR